MELEEFYKQVGGNFEDVKRQVLIWDLMIYIKQVVIWQNV